MCSRLLFLCLLAFFLVAGAPGLKPAAAQDRMAALTPDELAPGFKACMEKAQTDFDMCDCYSTAADHWDAILNANFKKALEGCAGAEDAKACRDTLREAQRAWMRYRDAMIPLIWPKDGGTLQRVEANAFVAEETKKQALILGRVE